MKGKKKNTKKKTSTRVLIGAGIGAAAILIALSINEATKLKELSSDLVIDTKGRIHNISLSALELAVDVTLKNLSPGSLTIKHPFVRLLYKGEDFLSSEIKNKDYILKPFAQIKLDAVYFKIPMLTLATKLPGMLSQYQKNGKLAFDVITKTTIGGRIPISKKDSIEFKRK